MKEGRAEQLNRLEADGGFYDLVIGPAALRSRMGRTDRSAVLTGGHFFF